jgi:hypothetical protein
MVQLGAMVQPAIEPEHATMLGGADWLVAVTLDADGWPRAHVLQRTGWHIFRAESFMGEARVFTVALCSEVPGDVFAANVAAEGAPLGLLYISLSTRQRVRVNGLTIASEHGADVRAKVAHSFGNCPKYIAGREVALRAEPAAGAGPRGREVLPPGEARASFVRRLFARADMMSVAVPLDLSPWIIYQGLGSRSIDILWDSTIQVPPAPGPQTQDSGSGRLAQVRGDGRRAPLGTPDPGPASSVSVDRLAMGRFYEDSGPGACVLGAGNAAHGVDVSHRGGRPGFVRVDAAGESLRLPDYQGNQFYMTLGNLRRE